MSRRQISLKGLMALIALFAVGFVALKNPSEIWASFLFSLTLAVLATATLAAAAARGDDRVRWLGFATFGWVYLIFTFLVPRPDPLQRHGTPALVTDIVHIFFDQNRIEPTLHVRGILHSIGAAISAVLGYILADLMTQRGVPLSPRFTTDEHHRGDPPCDPSQP
jgi:hypothetical protein